MTREPLQITCSKQKRYFKEPRRVNAWRSNIFFLDIVETYSNYGINNLYYSFILKF